MQAVLVNKVLLTATHCVCTVYSYIYTNRAELKNCHGHYRWPTKPKILNMWSFTEKNLSTSVLKHIKLHLDPHIRTPIIQFPNARGLKPKYNLRRMDPSTLICVCAGSGKVVRVVGRVRHYVPFRIRGSRIRDFRKCREGKLVFDWGSSKDFLRELEHGLGWGKYQVWMGREKKKSHFWWYSKRRLMV